MNYKVIFYVGLTLTIITLIITIIAFFKCNVIEIICDLFGFKRGMKLSNKPKKKSHKDTIKVKKVDEVHVINKNDLEDKYPTRHYDIQKVEESTQNLQKGVGAYVEEGTMLLEEEETSILEESTTLLDEETSLLDEETSLLDEETSLLDEETTLLEDEETSLLEEACDTGYSDVFVNELDIVIVHTDVII